MNRILSILSFFLVALCGLPSFAVETHTLPLEQQIRHEATLVVKITHADLTGTTTNATAQTIAVFDVVDKKAVSVVKSVLKTAFADSATAGYDSLLMEVGDGGDTDRLLTSTQINVNGTEVNQKVGTGTLYAYTSADTVDVKLTPKAGYTGAQLNTGEVWIYLKVHDDR